MARNGLTPRQVRTVAAVLEEPSLSAAARAAGVGLRTVRRWLAEDRAFQSALADASRDRLGDTVRRLRAASGRALDTLVALLAADNPSLRLRAAERLLDTAVRVEVTELAARVTALEHAAVEKTRWH